MTPDAYPLATNTNAIPTEESKQVHDVLQGKGGPFVPEDGEIPYGRHGYRNKMRCPQGGTEVPLQDSSTIKIGDGMKTIKIPTVQHEMLVSLSKKWKIRPEELIVELIEENYNSKTKRK